MPWYEYGRIAGERPRPLLEVRLWYGDRSVFVVGLVDSGADSSVLDARHADLLGLGRAVAQTATSLGADGRAFSVLRWPDALLEIEFEHYRFPFLGAFIDFPPSSVPVNVLGRQDFFSQFVVQFWDAAGLLNIDRSPEFATRPLP